MIKRIVVMVAVACAAMLGASAQEPSVWRPLYSVAKPKLDWSNAPAFPTDEIAAGVNGRMMFKVCTDPAGGVTSFSETHSSMSEKVTQATADWIRSSRFEPAMNIDRAPVADCDNELTFHWLPKHDAADATPNRAYPLQPILVPEYPGAARRAGEVGSTGAVFCIDAIGAVTQVSSLTPAGTRLAGAFERWLRQTRFTPVLVDGQAAPACDLTYDMIWTMQAR